MFVCILFLQLHNNDHRYACDNAYKRQRQQAWKQRHAPTILDSTTAKSASWSTGLRKSSISAVNSTCMCMSVCVCVCVCVHVCVLMCNGTMITVTMHGGRQIRMAAEIHEDGLRLLLLLMRMMMCAYTACSSSSMPMPVLAEISTIMVSPPISSSTTPCDISSLRILSGSAPADVCSGASNNA